MFEDFSTLLFPEGNWTPSNSIFPGKMAVFEVLVLSEAGWTEVSALSEAGWTEASVLSEAG